MTISQQRFIPAAAMFVVLGAVPQPTAARARNHHDPGTRAIRAAVMDTDVVADIISTVEAGDAAVYNQPIAVIATRSGSRVRVVLETPPRGVLGNAEGAKDIATATYVGDVGAMETNPNYVPDATEDIDTNMPIAAGRACERLAALHKLTSSFVLDVQTEDGRDYSVIYSPIPYSESQTQIVTLRGIGKPRSMQDSIPALPAPTPSDTPAPDASAPPPQPAPGTNVDANT